MKNSTPRKNAEATRGRPFKKGNPGRPRGAKNKTTLACEALMEGEANKLTRTVIELAKGGDSIALRLCLERIYPVRKGRLVEIKIPKIKSVSDVVKAFGVTVDAVANGEITPDEGSAIASLLENKRKANEQIRKTYC